MKKKPDVRKILLFVIPPIIAVLLLIIFLVYINNDVKHTVDITEEKSQVAFTEPLEELLTTSVEMSTEESKIVSESPSPEGSKEAESESTKESEPTSKKEAESESASAGQDETKQTSEESQTTLPGEPQADRITYQEGFYYESLSQAVKDRITGISYPEDCTIPYEDLRYVSVYYINFSGESAIGELVCNKAVAQDFVEIFYELYLADYQIEKIRLIDEYDGNDRSSMGDNNTSSFNYRLVSGTKHLSQHAYGTAIDVNPFYNPYCEGDDYVSPPGSEPYADRSADFPHKIDKNDLCYKLFTDRGFSWGGSWNSCKDYQHFQRKLQ